MTAIEDARAALAAWDADDPDVDFGSTIEAGVALETALRALIAEHERLTTPPTDDEREALYDGAWRAISGRDEPWGGCAEREKVMRVAEFAAGFRRQGPSTDEWEYGNNRNGSGWDQGAMLRCERWEASHRRRPAIPAGPWEPVEAARDA